uniref:Uncharacterized protein n=1 Tax=Rhizophora mucronata TaxID=61149 RepID=A0A2P2NJU5_RHIMU
MNINLQYAIIVDTNFQYVGKHITGFFISLTSFITGIFRRFHHTDSCT